MNSRRLELALKCLKPAEWDRFEKLASVFLADDYSDLRTTAAQSGDGGRDAELYTSDGQSRILFQFSVATDWKAKIANTVNRLKDTHPECIALIYMTNQVIGASGDSLKAKLHKDHGISLDIRDRNWFCERVNQSTAKAIAAEELAVAVVDPLLPEETAERIRTGDLTHSEASAALMFLGLQWKDDARDRGLTKITFDAIVQAALVDTNASSRIDEAAMRRSVYGILQPHPPAVLDRYITSALERLEGNQVKRYRDGTLCLSHEKFVAMQQFREEQESRDRGLSLAIQAVSTSMLSRLGTPDIYVDEFGRVLLASVNGILLRRSQAFAMAVEAGTLDAFAESDFSDDLLRSMVKPALSKIKGVSWLDALKAGVREIILSSDPAIHSYLRSLADCYTLLAFLRLTPDVQSAVGKLFAQATIWIDTNVILPLFADTLNSDDGDVAHFTQLFVAARAAEMSLFVTPGVLEELRGHISRCLACNATQYGYWEGGVPYLLSKYIESGRSKDDFVRWIENFCGNADPETDLAEYLEETYAIRRKAFDLSGSSEQDELRHSLEQIWFERHKTLQSGGHTYFDDATASRLINHDVECYVGVVHLRSQQGHSPYGYNAWWLTIDRKAFSLHDSLRKQMVAEPPPSPVMGIDFLANYLAFGPNRSRVGKSTEVQLPLASALGGVVHLTPDLMREAQSIRDSQRGLPERIVRRRVRDFLNSARASLGPMARISTELLDT